MIASATTCLKFRIVRNPEVRQDEVQLGQARDLRGGGVRGKRVAGHWLAVDRCFRRKDRADARMYATRRLMEIEGRPIAEVEVDAVVVRCPMNHLWE